MNVYTYQPGTSSALLFLSTTHHFDLCATNMQPTLTTKQFRALKATAWLNWAPGHHAYSMAELKALYGQHLILVALVKLVEVWLHVQYVRTYGG